MQAAAGRPTPQDLKSQLAKGALKKAKQRLPAYVEALSPITPLNAHKSGAATGTHHGSSEYERRGAPGSFGHRRNHQDSAFNYRKQTLGDEDPEQTLRGVPLELPGSNTEVEMGAMASTPHKAPPQFNTPSLNEAIGTYERTPRNFTQPHSHMHSGAPVAQGKLQATGSGTAGRAMMERVAEEQVLEEETGDYMLKAMPTSITTAGIAVSAAQNG